MVHVVEFDPLRATFRTTTRTFFIPGLLWCEVYAPSHLSILVF
jgi:hypothetical protein